MNIEVGKHYHMRNGNIAKIERRNPKSTFYMQGRHQHITKSGNVKWKFNIWAPDGRFAAIGESEFDIISEAE